jgi:fatty-acyl-CoA synthase
MPARARVRRCGGARRGMRAARATPEPCGPTRHRAPASAPRRSGTLVAWIRCMSVARKLVTAVERPRTLVEALEALPASSDRGFRFRGLDNSDRHYRWHELVAEARRRAGLLMGTGLRKGDRLALVIAEPHEFVLTFLGAVMAGIVPVPMYPRASFRAKNSYLETIAHIVDSARVRSLVTLEAQKPAIDELLARRARLESVWIGERLFHPDARPSRNARLPNVDPSDLCFLQFTSGSTSLPKGVMVSHRNLIANAEAFLGPEGADRRDDDVTVTWLPLFHDMGLIGFVLGTIVWDIPSVLLPTEAFARRPTMWMQAMHDYGGTIMFAPNFAYALAVKRTRDRDLEGLDLSKVRIAGCGAEPINPRVLRAFAERFAPAGFDEKALMPAYGMAESTLAISFHPRGEPLVLDRVSAAALRGGCARPAVGDEDAVELVACGRPFSGHSLHIAGDDGGALPERSVGEIVVRGPSVTAGYYQDPEATARSHRGGFLHTGDLGYLADGQLYVCGRIKDLIIIRGSNYYPQDIEWSVADVPGLRRDSVVAFSTLQDGDETLVVAAEGNSSDADDLRAAISAKIADTHGLVAGRVAIVRVGSLPKTSSGKPQRAKTKTLFELGQLEEHGPTPSP